LLSAAIKSIQAQSFTDWELIVIDDGLNPEPKKVVEDFVRQDPRITCITNEMNLGIQKALNYGVRKARGDYIARIDDDDVWIDSEKLTEQVRYLIQNPEYILVGTSAIICDDFGRELGAYSLPQTDEAIRKRMLSKNCFIHPSIVMRASAVLQAGGYSESEEVKHIEDYDLWLRLGLIGKFANFTTQSVQLTIHEHSMTFQNRLVQAKRMYALSSKYKKTYPHFYISRFVLLLRILGFTILAFIPLPKEILYTIQKIYKGY
jgi:glycosyltransferase involved in cell wall biosynthesis